MAVDIGRLSSLRQARARRHSLSSYLHLDGSRYLLIAVILLCLVSMATLWQTGVVATRGYAIANLEEQRTVLLRERSKLQLQYAAAQSLDYVRKRADQLGLRPMTQDQVHYVTVGERPQASMQEKSHP